MIHEGIVKAVDAVKCCNCGALMSKDSNDYISIYGNICIGESGGIIGNNLSEDNRVERATIFCRTDKCLEDLIKKFKPSVSDYTILKELLKS